MFIVILENLAAVSDHYHHGGGLAIVASSFEEALALANARPGVEITVEDIKAALKEGNLYEVKEHHLPKVYVFPDAGCC